ncbi:MAG: ABC transporter ATP-binding protein [bacterium]
MSLIELQQVRKVYRITRRQQGWLGALRTLIRPDYDQIEALRGISFHIESGECLGYIGPNGAGKSTTIKLMTGILVPNSGLVRVNGIVPWQRRRDNAWQIGVVFGQRTQLYWDLPLLDSFELLKRIYRVPHDQYKETLADLGALLGLQEFLHTPVRQLSLGQRMRGDLTAALLHSPRILYLDEPTIGLDVLAKERILEFIREINRSRGVTIILTTHNLPEVERLCSRIILIDKGLILYDGTVEGLKRQYAPWRTLVLQFNAVIPRAFPDGAVPMRWDGQTVWLRFDRDRSPYELIQKVVATAPIQNLSIDEPTLEEIIRDIYRSREESGEPTWPERSAHT